MARDLFDCPWCGSAQSIEHGICQLCMMEYPVETKIILLEPRRAEKSALARLAPKPGAAGAE